jgi:hypothetical protein
MSEVRTSRLRRVLLPLAVFFLLMGAHVAWAARPRQAAEPESCCAACATKAAATSPLRQYVDEQDYLLGYSYALAGAFAAVSLRRFREERHARGAALGIASAGASGFLAFAGCWLVGCCGSPMLGVYLGVFGAAFLPFVKPLTAALTTVSIGIGAWLLRRRSLSTAMTCACALAAPCNRGTSDLAANPVEERARELGARSPGPADPFAPDPAPIVLEGRMPERLVQDPAGYFVIHVDRRARRLLLEHYSNDGRLTAVIHGRHPAELTAVAIERGLLSRLDHAAYLGRELARAEAALAPGEPFVQDAAPESAGPGAGS